MNQLSLKAPGPSTLMSSIGARVFGSAKEPQQPQPKLQPNPSFRTAGTELVNIDLENNSLRTKYFIEYKKDLLKVSSHITYNYTDH